MYSAAGIQQQLTNAQSNNKESIDTKENSDKLGYFKSRLLSMVTILKMELADVDSIASFLVQSWYAEALRALQLQQSNISIDLKSCQQELKELLTRFLQVYLQAYTEIEKTESLEKLFDFLYSSQWEIKYFRDKKLEMFKQQLLKLNNKLDNKTIDECFHRTPNFIYCSRVIGFYQEMLDLIKPAIEWRQIMYWSYTTITVTPKNDSNPSKSYNLVYQTSLSTASQLFNKEYQELYDYLIQKQKERPSFSPLIDGTIKKLHLVADTTTKLCNERSKKVKSNSPIPREETKQIFYTIIDLVTSLQDIKETFEFESKLLEEKLIFGRSQTQHQTQQNLANESPLKSPIQAEVTKTENSKIEDIKGANEAFKAFEIKQRKKIDEYKAKILERKKNKDNLRKTLITQIKSGQTASKSILRGILEHLKLCTAEEFKTIQDILKHAKLEAAPVHSILVKLGFIAEKIASQGYKYKLGPFSTTYHPPHASTAIAGSLPQDFASQLRKILWGLGLDKALIESFQKRLSFNTKQQSTHSMNKTLFMSDLKSASRKTGKDAKGINSAAKTAATAATAATTTDAGAEPAAGTSISENVTQSSSVVSVGAPKKKNKKKKK